MTERWTVARAEWLRCVADGLEAGAITPTEDVRRPGAAPSSAWTRSRRESAAWLAEHGLPAEAPEVFRVEV